MNQTGIFRQLEQRAEGETPDRSPVRHRTLTLFKQHTHTYRQSDKPTVHVLACGSKPEQHRAHAGTGKTTQLKSNTQPSSYEAHFHQWCLFFFRTTLSNAAVDVFVKQKNLRFTSVRSEGEPQRNLLSHLHVCKLADNIHSAQSNAARTPQLARCCSHSSQVRSEAQLDYSCSCVLFS